MAALFGHEALTMEPRNRLVLWACSEAATGGAWKNLGQPQPHPLLSKL